MTPPPPPATEGLRVSARLTIPPEELHWRFSRSSGPGGQSVNTSDSRASVSFDVARSAVLSEPARARAVLRLADRLRDGVLTVTAADERSQWRNRQLALERLGALLRAALAAPPRARRPTRPSRGAVERRLADKRRQSKRKTDRDPRRRPED